MFIDKDYAMDFNDAVALHAGHKLGIMIKIAPFWFPIRDE
jgi:hypothetical protein